MPLDSMAPPQGRMRTRTQKRPVSHLQALDALLRLCFLKLCEGVDARLVRPRILGLWSCARLLIPAASVRVKESIFNKADGAQLARRQIPGLCARLQLACSRDR